MHFKTYLPLIPFFVTVATALLSAEPGEFQLIDILENGVSLRNNTLFFIDGYAYVPAISNDYTWQGYPLSWISYYYNIIANISFQANTINLDLTSTSTYSLGISSLTPSVTSWIGGSRDPLYLAVDASFGNSTKSTYHYGHLRFVTVDQYNAAKGDLVWAWSLNTTTGVVQPWIKKEKRADGGEDGTDASLAWWAMHDDTNVKVKKVVLSRVDLRQVYGTRIDVRMT